MKFKEILQRIEALAKNLKGFSPESFGDYVLKETGKTSGRKYWYNIISRIEKGSVTLKDIALLAGFFGSDESYILFGKVPPQGGDPEDAVKEKFTMSGNSMEYLYENGDTLFCTEIDPDGFIAHGDPYLMEIKGHPIPFVRYITSVTEDHFLTSAENPDFPPQEVPRSKVKSLYQVTAFKRNATRKRVGPITKPLQNIDDKLKGIQSELADNLAKEAREKISSSKGKGQIKPSPQKGDKG